MARIRTVKPDFFKNEDLAALSAHTRLLFIGLFQQADSEGRLLHRPKRLKAEIFPYEDGIEVEKLINSLEKAGFIHIYEVENQKIIEIPTFLTHQRLTTKEALTPSIIPKRPVNTRGLSPEQPRDISGLQPGSLEGKGKERKGKEVYVETKVSPDESSYSSVEKTKKGIYEYLQDRTITEIQPYIDFWNLFAQEKKLPQVSKITDKRKKKFNIRVKDPGFDIAQILRKAGKSEFICGGNWFTFDWIVENESNFLQVLEGKYDNKKTVINEPNRSLSDYQEEKGKRIINSVE